MTYYYIVFSWGCNNVGNAVLPQEAPDGSLNLAAAHDYLMQALGEVCVILDYKELTKQRYDQMMEWIRRMHTQQSPPGAQGLTVIKGEKSPDAPRGKPLGDLKPVE